MSIKNSFLALLLRIAYATAIIFSYLISSLLLALIFLTSLIIGTLIFASLILLLNMILIPPLLLFSGLVVGFSALFTSTIYKFESFFSNKDRLFTNEDYTCLLESLTYYPAFNDILSQSLNFPSPNENNILSN
ncbi:36468_t:CDS:1, partial [Gigaspora margarita]